MVRRAMRFTPEVLLSAPRRSAGVPNPSGTKVLYTTSSYDFKSHNKTSELRLLDVNSGDSHELAKNDEISDLNWLDDETFACLQAEKDGSTSIYVANISKMPDSKASHYVAGKIDTGASNLKVVPLDGDGKAFAVMVSAPSLPDGSMHTINDTSKKTYSSGHLYTSNFVRHWDAYETKPKSSLWFGTLSKAKDEKYELSKLQNALKGSRLECPIPPFGGGDNFDIGPQGAILVAKDPNLDPALNTKCNVYLLQIKSWTQPETPHLEELAIEGFEGAASSPVLSPRGNGGAFLMMKQNGYEADQNRIFIIEDFNVQQSKPRVACLNERLSAFSEDPFWRKSPSSIAFAADSHSLLVTAEDESVGKLYEIQLEPDSAKGQEVHALTQHGNVSSFKPLKGNRTFFSASSLVDNSFYGILSFEPNAAEVASVWTHSNSGEGGKFGLRPSQVSSIWSPANDPKVNKKVHSIVVKPSFYEDGKKYPVAYLIHGGPQGAWTDAWSTRWNPAVFAEQGYIVVAPNPTGSTGYGQPFTDAIRCNWGGDPYEDIVNVFEWVGKNMPDADNSRAVALGGSYGGYMVNWIQGHDLGRKFKALVCHDGVTTFAGGQLSTDELYFPFHDLGRPSWYDSKSKQRSAEAQHKFGSASTDAWKKWDPSDFFDNWETPQLVIHSEKDFRLPVSEGLAAFNVLQSRGVESQFLHFPDENHWVLKPENSLVWHKTVLNFINRHAGLPPYTEQSPDSDEYYGGIQEKTEAEDAQKMPTQGQRND